MDYLTPVAYRTISFKEFMHEWVIEHYMQSLDEFGLEKPWYWPRFIESLDYFHHMIYASAYTYRATVWFDLTLPGPEDYRWLQQKYPNSWPELQPIWQNINSQWQKSGPGIDFSVHAFAIPAFCDLCQLVLCQGRPNQNLTNTFHTADKSFVFCSPECRWIFTTEQERYQEHREIVKRVLAGVAPGNLMEFLVDYSSLDEELALKAMRQGAQDYLVKGEFTSRALARVVNFAVARKHSETNTQKELEDEVTQSRKQLRHAEKLTTLGQLAAGVAHEIGTPLNVISGRAQMISQASLATYQIKNHVRIIHEQAERISSIVRQLLAFSRPAPMGKGQFDIKTAIINAINLVHPIAKKQQVRFILQNDENEIFNVWANPDQMEQVFTNLMMNAIQALPEGGDIKIHMHNDFYHSKKSASQQNGVTILLEDTGVGIPPGNLPLIFDPFFTTKSVGEGTGLGLSIVFGIIQDHGGQIHVSSQEQLGTAFRIWLPKDLMQ